MAKFLVKRERCRISSFCGKPVFHTENVENVEKFVFRGVKKPRKHGKTKKLPTAFSTLSPAFCGKLKKNEKCAICTNFPFNGRKMGEGNCKKTAIFARKIL